VSLRAIVFQTDEASGLVRFLFICKLADTGNSAGQGTSEQFLYCNGVTALLMGNEEFTIAFPLAFVKLHRVNSMGAPHVDLELGKFKPFGLIRILDAFFNLHSHFRIHAAASLGELECAKQKSTTPVKAVVLWRQCLPLLLN
jgi:hypothetical protein